MSSPERLARLRFACELLYPVELLELLGALSLEVERRGDTAAAESLTRAALEHLRFVERSKTPPEPPPSHPRENGAAG